MRPPIAPCDREGRALPVRADARFRPADGGGFPPSGAIGDSIVLKAKTATSSQLVIGLMFGNYLSQRSDLGDGNLNQACETKGTIPKINFTDTSG
jgi:hypothetical protein